MISFTRHLGRWRGALAAFTLASKNTTRRTKRRLLLKLERWRKIGLDSILVAAEGLTIGEDMEDTEDGDLTIVVNPSGEADVECSA